MALIYIPRNLWQVDVNIDKFIEHLKVMGFTYLFDVVINDKQHATINYPNKDEFMIQYNKVSEAHEEADQ